MFPKIVIPSHKRADNVISKDLVLDPIICVPKSQEDEYKAYNPDCEICTHPDSVVGLPAKRNWMVQHFGELFMIDDDVYEVQPLYAPLDESALKIRDKQRVTDIITNLYEMAKALDIHIFGFDKNPNVKFYNPFKPFSLDKAITGCSYGVIRSENTKWLDGLVLKEDFWISCYVKYTERQILVDNRFSFKQKDTFVNPGGLSEFRNSQREKDAVLLMRQYFGEVVNLKTFTSKQGNETSINMNVKFPF